jgi:hypothetical protein
MSLSMIQLNVVYANGNVYAKGLILGSTGLRAGNLLVLDATAATSSEHSW